MDSCLVAHLHEIQITSSQNVLLYLVYKMLPLKNGVTFLIRLINFNPTEEQMMAAYHKVAVVHTYKGYISYNID